MPLNVERDKRICKLYTEGVTPTELSRQFHLTRSRIIQIIKLSGVPMQNKIFRDEFLGVNLTESVKRSLKDEAEKRGLSMSNLTSKTITEMLDSLGYKENE